MSSWMKWWYHDANGKPVFQHYRVSDPSLPRGKRYGYRYPTKTRDNVVLDWDYHKHPVADWLIYRLPLVLANRSERLFINEGERATDVFLDQGVLATSGHGGAGKFTREQAEHLRRHKGDIVLIADRDAPGAYDACRKYDLLRAVGIPASRLSTFRAVPTHMGADARDHFEAGYGIEDFRPVPLVTLRGIAESVTAATFDDDGYCTPEEIEDLKHWQPKVVPRRPR